MSTFLSAAGGFVSLYFLARLLSKDELGGYAFTFNILTLLALVAAWGFERNIMLRVARFSSAPADLRGRGLALRATIISVLLALALAVGLLVAAPQLGMIGATEEARAWIPLLAVALVPMAAAAPLQAWFRANGRVATASMSYGLVNASRAVLLALVFLLGGAAPAVAIAVVISTLVPILLIGWAGRHARTRPPVYLRPSDIWTGAVVVVQKISNYGLRIIDVILVGLLITAAETAEYAVAARLAVFCGMGSEALQPTFVPRGRRHFATGNHAAAFREYHLARASGFVISLGVATLLAVVGPLLLGIFGAFQPAYGPMLVLSAGYVVTAGAGLHFPYLLTRGELFGTTILRLCALLLLIGSAFVLVPPLGVLGGALALGLAVLALNVAALIYLHHLTGFWGMTRPSVALVGAATLLLLAGGLDLIAPAPLVVALLGVGVAAFVIDHHTKAAGLAVLRRVRAPS
ncbi:oligosaccharide flippase family protein [Roseobacter sp. WL0113]|uniref:Oligosaccharide flippase family protein n=1 Tax=Roseobacter sinensis TaxID=2931391 RepID=A0ABT3BJU9_9RHOB|nr:oligosaccharide flippase family protein [Roseobacter sp. WL0113]